MAKGNDRKRALLYLATLFLEQAEADQGISTPEILACLTQRGAAVEPEELPAVFEELRGYGVNVVARQDRTGLIYHLAHEDEDEEDLAADTVVDETARADFTVRNMLIIQDHLLNSMDELRCGVFAYTLPERTVLLVNDALKNIYGIQDTAWHSIGKAMMRYVLSEDLPAIRDAVTGLAQVGDSVDYKYRIQRRDGEIATLECLTTCQALQDGTRFILSMVKDVTIQEELQVSLRREQMLYRHALTRGVDCCFTFDVTTGLISESVLIHGTDMLESLGLSLPAHYDEFSRRFLEYYQVKFTDQSMGACYSCRELERLYDSGCYSIEATCSMLRTGVYYSALVVMSRDEEDGHLYALYFSRDITEQQQREDARRKELEDAREELTRANREMHQALRSEREKTRVIGAISNGYIAIFRVDLETGAYWEVNDSHYLAEIYQNCPSAMDAFPRLITAMVAPQFQERTAQFVQFSTLQERMQGEKSISIEYLTTAGSWVRSSIIEARREADGTLTEVLFATERIDEEKRKELIQQEALKDAYLAANRASEAKTNFLSSMSHDIRTPLNVIIGMTAIAGTHIEDRDRVSDCLGKIATSSKHLLGLINEVLDMSKIESGKLELCPEEFNLSDLVDNLLIMVRPQVEARRHTLLVHIDHVEHERVVGDSQRIQQVFMNLMSNAIKYTPEGGRIEFSISEKPTNHRLIGCYEFVFQDNGIGMSEEFVPHIFEAFSRARDSVVEKMQGTGLGMAITNNIVQMMDGDIKVESKLGEGSRFTVTIYLELQDVDESLKAERFVDLPVLVVDDDLFACESTCAVLCGLGMHGEWVLTGMEAVERVDQRHQTGNDFFAVIVDWKMPDMDGVATTRAIRKRVGNDVPIIILSAYDWSEIEVEARAAGANAFLSKPIFRSRIAHLFHTLMDKTPEDAAEFNLRDFAREDFSGRRALLVEDNAINAEIACEILGMTGLEVELAENGKEAVDRITQVPDDYYDIIFMDVRMPIMNGYEATRAIRAMDRPYAKRVPILAMTANAFAEDVQDSKNAGMNEHIAKPLNFEDLLRALNHWLV